MIACHPQIYFLLFSPLALTFNASSLKLLPLSALHPVPTEQPSTRSWGMCLIPASTSEAKNLGEGKNGISIAGAINSALRLMNIIGNLIKRKEREYLTPEPSELQSRIIKLSL